MRLNNSGHFSFKDVVYQYVTGQEFALHIKAVVTSFERMQAQLDKERRAMQRIWKDREEQIEVVLDNVIGMRGYIEGEGRWPEDPAGDRDTVTRRRGGGWGVGSRG